MTDAGVEEGACGVDSGLEVFCQSPIAAALNPANIQWKQRG
jgi:hypothetical protein